MQIHGVQQRASRVVLDLTVGVIADPHRAGPFIAREVIEHLLSELALAVDRVHHLEIRLPLGDIGDEIEEVVGLRLEPERVQTPQAKRGIAYPRVSVIPVALAPGVSGSEVVAAASIAPVGA